MGKVITYGNSTNMMIFAQIEIFLFKIGVQFLSHWNFLELGNLNSFQFDLRSLAMQYHDTMYEDLLSMQLTMACNTTVLLSCHLVFSYAE